MNLAYLAGLIDGEGCLSFTRVRKSIYPQITITNTNLALLEDVKRDFGGNIQPLWRKDLGWKQGFYWRVSWSRAVEIADKVRKYLRVKGNQADLFFAWDAVRPGQGIRFDAAAAKLLVDQCHWLNRRGPPMYGPDPVDVALSEDT